ncbi:ergothioneine biosynthesis protein EgtB [Flavihumibacter sp. R14]|nr:ergothioneine biosynthesis protein EgtB [Flavihumibacter soli]
MLLQQYREVRKHTEMICSGLLTEDYVVQPIVDVSPPKWHLGHTTWFFETFFLKPFGENYQEFDPDYNFVFNSYYETVGARVIRTDRGNLSRPGVEDVYRYRQYVDKAMEDFLNRKSLNDNETEILILGLNHEQQHQELLCTDIKYILGNNPLFPSYTTLSSLQMVAESSGDNGIGPESFSPFVSSELIRISEGIYEVGFSGAGFCFDNELKRHKVYLQNYSISPALVTNKEYMEFISAGGYSDFRYWHADGWEWVKTNQVRSPMYWHEIDGEWLNYTYEGLIPVQENEPLCHVSFYEAAAYASWKGMRLPTEFEWEVAADKFNWGQRWEWTESAYLPYPGFTKAPGAIGEYNGKFMVNQMVLRGASEVTSPQHSRCTYRNFFQPPLRWQFTGIRLAK